MSRMLLAVAAAIADAHDIACGRPRGPLFRMTEHAERPVGLQDDDEDAIEIAEAGAPNGHQHLIL